MAKYRKKSDIIDAVQWTGKNIDEITKFMKNKTYCYKNNKLLIVTPKGNYIASMGDYVIKDIKGEFYSFTKEVFEKNYDFLKD